MVALSARADDGYQLLGFSPDGAFVAVMAHGTGEGSGNPWAKITVVDIKKKAPVGAPISVELDLGTDPSATETMAVAQAEKRLEATREKLRVSSWVAPRQIKLSAKGEMTGRDDGPLGSIEVKTRNAKAKDQSAPCDAPFRAGLLRVSLFLLDDDKPVVLLDEKELSPGRSCSNRCGVEAVYASGKSMLATVGCDVPGFEGSKRMRFPVSAVLEYGLDPDIPATPAAP
jgi:predicted secreted protein